MTEVATVDSVVIRFAGDSGDGMQLTGDRFTHDAAAAGNDFSTLPNFPAEIRAPVGTLAGVSSFQLQFAAHHVHTPGDQVDVLVAMNPAALKANIADLRSGGVLIVDNADFTARNLAKVGYTEDPLTDGSLDAIQVHAFDLSSLAVGAVAELGLNRREALRTKNMFALGLLDWLYTRPEAITLNFLERKFADRPALLAANVAAVKAGYAFGETSELFHHRYVVPPAPITAGTYRRVSGNLALAYGLLAGAAKAGLQLFLGAYPITPASDVLHHLARLKSSGVLTFQAEDEIAAVGAAVGASFAGQLGVTATSGPGMALKAETIGLAVMLELPLIVCDIQRAGPSTGMPTKTEQGDLNQALFGRPGEAPLPVIAAQSPADCFAAAYEAARIAIEFRTPVILLSDGFLANSSEPWQVPQLSELPEIHPNFATEPNRPDGRYWPYLRDERLARSWAIPGTPGLEHRVGGLEKADGSGGISYDPANHEAMTRLRQAKLERVIEFVPDLPVDDPDGSADLLVLGWGSSYGPIQAAARQVREAGHSVAIAGLRHLNPLPANLGEVLRRYRKVIVPELNLGQLTMLLRARYLVDVTSYTKVAGLPLSQAELAADLISIIKEDLR